MRRSRQRTGLSLPEALIAISIVGLASASLLMSTQLAFDSTTSTRDSMIADGLAGFLLSEVGGLPYHDKSETAYDANLGPESGETSRADFDDIDDFNGLVMAPITDEWEIQVGHENSGGSQRVSTMQANLDEWRATFLVTYADAANPANDLSSGTSDMRAVYVVIEKKIGSTWDTITTRRRVFTYVPTP